MEGFNGLLDGLFLLRDEPVHQLLHLHGVVLHFERFLPEFTSPLGGFVFALVEASA